MGSHQLWFSPEGSPTWTTFIGAFVAILAICITTNAIYSVTLHPLARIPGPRLCAVSRIPWYRASFSGEDVHWMRKLHTRYGPVVRFGPTDVSYTAPEAWDEIYGHPKGRKENEKAREFNLRPCNGVPSMVTATWEDHTRVRHIFSPAFSERALRKQEPMMQKYVALLVSKLRELGRGADGTSTKPVEMTRLFNFTTFDIMAELCFGRPLGLLAKNEFSPWVRSIFNSLSWTLPLSSTIAYYPLLNALFERFEPKWVTEQRKAHCQHSAERVDQRLLEGSNQPDIWDFVMSAPEGKELTIGEMHSNAEIFMLAGSETTATLLSGVTYYLLANPESMKLLVQEIRGAFSSASEISFDRLANLKYLNACLKDTLRIYPPAPMGSPRVIPAGGQAILGRWIPPATRVSVHHYSTYRSEANFKNCDAFVPERWLGDPAYADDARDAHQPFSVGARNCIGQSMAMHEMRLALAAVLFHFDLELCDESRGWIEQQAYSLWVKKPLLCRLRPVVGEEVD